MSRRNNELRPYHDILEDFRPPEADATQLDPDDKADLVKRVIYDRLDPVDRTIILLYADCGSLRKLGLRMGFSHMTMRREVIRIRKAIIEEYEKMKLNEK